MTLAAWQDRLQGRFQDLRQDRSALAGSDKPIFGLEHGLNTAEIQLLQSAVRTQIAAGPPRIEHALPWIVYACEVGYRYSGDEYWQTFEESTPGWTSYWTAHGERDWLRERFRWFHKQFGGAMPSGPWAAHFSIICWPITHAILPQDLQRQLAEILYQMRHLFTGDLLASPKALGEQIAARSWKATSRFQNLAQEPLLVGQIAAALLLRGKQSSENLIFPSTLARIGEDLDRARIAREWMRGAQQVAEQRVAFRGLASGRSAAEDTGSAADAHARITGLGMAPRLVLRPTSTGWDVVLEVPNLSHLLAKLPGLRGALTDSRCMIAGSSGRWLARGALLHDPEPAVLHAWPSSNEPLLRFEQPIPSEFEWLLRAECLLRPGPHWLFRIASDGLAYELHNHAVRPGQSYVLLNTSEPIKTRLDAQPIHVTCAGASAVRIDVPSAVPAEWFDYLQRLGLSLARSVHVWPAGLAAASWNGEGRAEWLTSDQPCIGIRPDHAIDRLVVTLGAAETQQLEVRSPKPGVPLFVELPPLAAGIHRLRVSTSPIESTDGERDGELEVIVREPRAWSPALATRGVFSVQIDPSTPTIEQLWEGRVSIEIRGPVGRSTSPVVSLFARHSTTPSIRKKLPPLGLPVDGRAWRSHFEKHFRDAKDVQNLYDPAHSCHLELDAEELGTFSTTCEREFSPLRWVVRRQSQGFTLWIIDDSGTSTLPEVARFDYQTPDVPVPIPFAQFAAGFAAPVTGGLYVARIGPHERALLLGATALTLQELILEPRLQARPRSAASVNDVLSLMRLWRGARLTGMLSATRKRAVLLALVEQVFSILGGQAWERAERALRTQDSQEAFEALRRAVSSKPGETRLAADLVLDSPMLASLDTKNRAARFSSTAQHFLQIPSRTSTAARGVNQETPFERVSGPSSAHWLYEFALRLASSPETIREWASQHLLPGLERLLDMPVLARAARLLVLAIDRDPRSSMAEESSLYRGWNWV